MDKRSSSRDQRDRVIVIGGPTASGKSALAFDMAEICNGVVINADSMQMYEDLRILTARPPVADCNEVPHRLYGVLDGDCRSSVAQWRDLAEGEIRAAFSQGRTPIVVGGTGLYLNALTQGLSPVPPSDAAVREQAMVRHEALGPTGFHADLARLDPVMAARLAPGDTQRCIRAWEVMVASGRSLADWQSLPLSGPPAGLSFSMVVLAPQREAVYQACNGRFATMVETGAVEEVRRLLDRNLPAGAPVLKAVGVRDLGAFLNGQATLDEAVASATMATRHYAKRQMTWFRHQVAYEDGDAPENGRIITKHSISKQYSKRLAPEILSLIRFLR